MKQQVVTPLPRFCLVAFWCFFDWRSQPCITWVGLVVSSKSKQRYVCVLSRSRSSPLCRLCSPPASEGIQELRVPHAVPARHGRDNVLCRGAQVVQRRQDQRHGGWAGASFFVLLTVPLWLVLCVVGTFCSDRAFRIGPVHFISEYLLKVCYIACDHGNWGTTEIKTRKKHFLTP